MYKFQILIDSIDWLFAAVLLLAGRYWARKYFRLAKHYRYNFLLFALIGGALYILFRWLDGYTIVGQATNFFVTFLFVTSFYELLAKHFFEWLESKVPVLAKAAGAEDDDGPGSNPSNPPPPPGT